MNSDMTVPCDQGFINIRVGAIILKDGKFLMVGNEKSDYLYSVGGRVKFRETAEDAAVREVLEETGVKMEIERLGFRSFPSFESPLLSRGIFHCSTKRTACNFCMLSPLFCHASAHNNI